MAKFAQLSQQTQTHQMNKKRTGKENSNPNLQNTLLQTASTTGTLGTRHNVIAPNTLIQAATIRMFRAMWLYLYAN
uniref:Uncharacterized protein n=1 Tax=Aegilops tauschii TaxID=37682 RepID=M8B050_AEGTA